MAYQQVLTALADPTRRQIFESLRDAPMSVSQIATHATVSRPAVSQHLKVLETAQLVNVQPRGTRRLYSVNNSGLAELRNYLDTFWDNALSAYAARIDALNNKENQS
ncbi:MAG: metalloregulator ArsR/SmtB family transcription factor [Pseudomonadota bacterium]